MGNKQSCGFFAAGEHLCLLFIKSLKYTGYNLAYVVNTYVD